MLVVQLEGFVETARQRNLSRAAEALHITQPALTARLRSLEDELGSPLFDRMHRGMRLTAAGQAFLPHAERALAAMEEGRTTVVEHATGLAGQLAIGTAPAVGAYVLPGLLARYVARYPAVRLSVQTGHSEEIVDAVARGELDIGLIRELHHPGVQSHALYEDELILVVPPTHEFAHQPRLELASLTETTLIMFDRASSYYQLTNATFRAAGIVPRGTIALDNIEAAKQMVRQGLGVAFLPHSAIAGDVARGTLRAVGLRGVQRMRRRIIAVRRAGSLPTAALVGFLDVLDGIGEILPDRGAILA
jgi:DNA-binding transcriptional LysR family regulator